MQLIDGSFISQKELPKDIDFVTFFDYKIYEREERFLDKYWTFSLENEGLDSYLVKTYPKEHIDYPKYFKFLEKWQERYQSIKHNDKQLQKGFLKIIFQ